MEKKEKILIIKTGYSEFLDIGSNSRKVSLGDVLRTTVILHPYKEKHITWVTDLEAFPLLENNLFIDRLLFYDFTTALQLESEEFDTIINLEKVPGICALSDKIRARKSRYGFTFNTQTGEADALDKAGEVLSLGANPNYKKEKKTTAQELLFEIVGKKWRGEEYILKHKSKSKELYDIGLNTQVGKKWPTKLWPKEYWNKLEKILVEKGLKLTRQDSKENKEKGILKDLETYINWINSNKIIVSGDTLGLHLGIVLKKNVLGLFGPTPYKEVYFYGRGKAILPESAPDCLPCFEKTCKRGKNCMEDISVERVYREIESILKGKNIIQERGYLR